MCPLAGRNPSRSRCRKPVSLHTQQVLGVLNRSGRVGERSVVCMSLTLKRIMDGWSTLSTTVDDDEESVTRCGGTSARCLGLFGLVTRSRAATTFSILPTRNFAIADAPFCSSTANHHVRASVRRSTSLSPFSACRHLTLACVWAKAGRSQKR